MSRMPPSSPRACEKLDDQPPGRSRDRDGQKLIQDFPLEGYVVKRDGNEVVIDLGNRHGVKRGMQFIVFKEGSIIKHPKTGEILDIEKVPTGSITITRIGSKIASARIASEVKPGSIEYGNMVKSSEEPVHIQVEVEKGSLVVNPFPNRPGFESSTSAPDTSAAWHSNRGSTRSRRRPKDSNAK